jgi:hypothetical protein
MVWCLPGRTYQVRRDAHRSVNGAHGDQFLARIKQLMDNFPDEA